MGEPILRFDRVWKSYEQAGREALHALRDISLGVEAGDKVAVIGRSGSGKSTLLHLAAGIDEPTRGAVSLLGTAFSRQSDRERTMRRREDVGLVFQFFHLLPHLSVFENVVLPARIAGDRGPAFVERARELLERVDLAGRSRDSVDRLSGGEMQRVAICRALLRRPRLLLADEPTGNLDDANARTVMELLLRLVDDERGTLIYVTHSREMATLAHRAFRLHSGVLDPA